MKMRELIANIARENISSIVIVGSSWWMDLRDDS